MGIIFPIYAFFFVEAKNKTFGIIFTCGCVVAGLAVGILCYLIGYWIIINTLNKISDKMSKTILDKNFKEIIQIQSDDKIGLLINNFNTLMKLIYSIMSNISDKSNNLNTVAGKLKISSTSINSSIQEMTEVSKTVTSKGKELKSDMGEVEAIAEGTNKNIKLLSDAAGLLAGHIENIANHSVKAFDISKTADEYIQKSVGQISDLNKTTTEIHGDIEVITKIADQIKLLALNATIEAERAGDAGRGFAVVANEIKELSTQTNQVVENIESKTTSIYSSSQETVQNITRLNEIYKQLFDIIDKVNTAIEEQSISSKRIAENVEQATKNINKLAEIIFNSAEKISHNNNKLNQMDESAKINHSSSQKVKELTDLLFILSDGLQSIVDELSI